MEKKFELTASPVCMTPIHAERGAFREIDDLCDEVIYLTAPRVFEWNETDNWRVANFIDDQNGREAAKDLKEWFFESEDKAVEFVMKEFNVDISMEAFNKKYGK